MAGLYDLVHITDPDATQKYWFRAAKGFYSDAAIATATGVVVSTDAADLKRPLTPVFELIRAGVLKNAVLTAVGTGGKRYRVKLHYAVGKSATVEAAMLALNVPNVAGKASSGAAFKSFGTTTNVTSRS
ncbi:hypothetical protein [Nostoc sp. TCL240-02]|uniref:hypothetical protein n=1 Tax=Nostoc sp. TCL240-02 TaxID=2572090 RepID=UPI00157FAF5C|nr:hypothetical protein [Nostoc sp. TCL240-02]QKQ76349.1 hypothetical protein FBB35_26430 [Nostoc sp. TCL240-02]